MTKIVIPKWLREENPICAGFCDIVNSALEANPNMSLAEFASELSKVNVEGSMERLERAERKQFSEERV